ncbi:MAG: hypothetical protein ABI670_22985 [Chloroflexota bacterium]
MLDNVWRWHITLQGFYNEPQAGRALQDIEGVTCNAEMRPAEIRDYCQLDATGQSRIKAAMRQLHLAARAYHSSPKLPRTIADVARSKRIDAAHLTEAVQHQPRQLAQALYLLFILRISWNLCSLRVVSALAEPNKISTATVTKFMKRSRVTASSDLV